MIKFYYHPLSPIARRVWLALLEKQLPFEPILVNLGRGEQRQEHYLAINPFHRVPAIIDGDRRIIESLAILDYLEMEYPQPSLTPKSSWKIAQMRMVQMVIVNEAVPLILTLATQEIKGTPEAEKLEKILAFLAEQLGDRPYFGDEQVNLADLVAGATIPLFCRLGVSLLDYPNLAQWLQNLSNREAWQQTEPSEQDLKRWQKYVQLRFNRFKKKSLPIIFDLGGDEFLPKPLYYDILFLSACE